MPAVSDIGNTKLGPAIYAWSIPAISSCPGRSGMCEARCYAHRGFYRMPGVNRCHRSNHEFCQLPEFTGWMIGELRRLCARQMRIHCAGDFFDVAYTRRWQQIVANSRHTRFFAYTRSWRDDAILPELVRLQQYKNMTLWWSTDRETGPAPLIRGVRQAYMAVDDLDARQAPDDCDLVFRHLPKTVMKEANGVLVCPPENGVTRTTCSQCGVCSDGKRPVRWEHLLQLQLPAQI